MKCLWVFVITMIPLFILEGLNFWQIRNVEQDWLPWLWYTLKWFPAFLLCQVLIYWVWGRGFHVLCDGKIWIVWLLWSAGAVTVSVVMTRAFFGQWPEKGALVGFVLYLIGAVIAAVWR